MAMSISTPAYRRLIVFGMILLGLYATRQYDYLLFHGIAEIFSIVIAASIFLFAWNSYEFSDNDYPLFIGVAFVGVAGVDLLHTLAYAGMNVFKGYDTNLPTQLWIIARSLQAVVLAIAPRYLTTKGKFQSPWLAFPVITLALVASVFGGAVSRLLCGGLRANPVQERQ